jgi:hypothetical protein
MNVYGIFWHRQATNDSESTNPRATAMWTLSRNKRKALRYARQVNGVVGMMRNQTRHDVWDAPTFRVCCEVIADYRK